MIGIYEPPTVGPAANIIGERTGMMSSGQVQIHTEGRTYVLQGKQVLKRLEIRSPYPGPDTVFLTTVNSYNNSKQCILHARYCIFFNLILTL